MLGAALRLATTVPGGLNTPPLAEPVYFTIDVLLTLGLIGLFTGMSALRTRAGAIGFALAILGILTIRTGPRLLSGQTYYTVGAGLIALGLAIAGLNLIRTQGLTRLVGAAWIASFVVGMFAAMSGIGALITLAAILFCVGFGIGGLFLVQRRGNA
jgi:hypothetical protein